MNTIEEFFKNRPSFNVEKGYYFCENRCLYDDFIYSSTIHNPQSLKIKNTFDLIEKLKPLVNYISSNIKKFIKEDEEYHPDCTFSISVIVDFSNEPFNNRYDEFRTDRIGLFECGYGPDCYGLRNLMGDMDIFQEIKTWMEDSIYENPYNLLFRNTSSFVVEVSHRNTWLYEEYFLETIDYKRTGSFRRLERFRESEALVNSSGHNFREPIRKKNQKLTQNKLLKLMNV